MEDSTKGASLQKILLYDHDGLYSIAISYHGVSIVSTLPTSLKIVGASELPQKYPLSSLFP